MEKLSFQIKEKFHVKPSIIYHAWLDSKIHSKMTGGEAIIDKSEGGLFTTWDGYISGRNIKLVENTEIVQHWRTIEFDDLDDDSELIIILKEIEEGCELTLIQNNIPQNQPDYEQGWIDNYFVPMKAYFQSEK